MVTVPTVTAQEILERWIGRAQIELACAQAEIAALKAQIANGSDTQRDG